MVAVILITIIAVVSGVSITTILYKKEKTIAMLQNQVLRLQKELLGLRDREVQLEGEIIRYRQNESNRAYDELRVKYNQLRDVCKDLQKKARAEGMSGTITTLEFIP